MKRHELPIVSWLTFVVLKSFQHILDIHEPGRLVKQIGKLYYKL
jgi:hypothetical protein